MNFWFIDEFLVYNGELGEGRVSNDNEGLIDVGHEVSDNIEGLF